MPFASIEEAAAELREGRMIIIVDDEDRENEGDLACAAECVGVLVRPGQTEAVVDMARIAGLYPAGVICEIMNPDGTMARLPQLEEFAARHRLKMITVADLVRYRMQKELLVRRAVETDLPTVYGLFRAVAFENVLSEEVHLAMVMGEVRTEDPVLVRV